MSIFIVGRRILEEILWNHGSWWMIAISSHWFFWKEFSWKLSWWILDDILGKFRWQIVNFVSFRHTTHSLNIKWQKCAGMGLNGFIFKKIDKNWRVRMKKKSWELFRRCLLNSKANPAQLGWKLAGLAVLFSSQLLNGSQDFFFFVLIF